MKTVKLHTIKHGGCFKIEDEGLSYWIRKEGANGRITCHCFTNEHLRYPHRDKYFKRDKQVIKFSPK